MYMCLPSKRGSGHCEIEYFSHIIIEYGEDLEEVRWPQYFRLVLGMKELTFA